MGRILDISEPFWEKCYEVNEVIAWLDLVPHTHTYIQDGIYSCLEITMAVIYRMFVGSAALSLRVRAKI